MSDQDVVIVDERGTEHVFPPGMDPVKAAGIVRQRSAELGRAVEAAKGARQRESEIYASEARKGALAQGKSFLEGAHAGFLQQLPNIAAIASTPFTGGMSLIPAMLTTGGAMAGGSLMRSALDDKAETAGDVTKSALKSGATGMVAEGAGRAIGPIVRGAGRLIGRAAVRGAVRPSAAIRREFGGSRAIADTILDERIPTATMAGRKLAGSADEVTSVLRAAAPEAAPIQPAELLDDVTPVIERAGKRASLGLADEGDDIIERLSAMERANPGGIDLLRAQDLKREAQDLAGAVYKARAAGHNVNSLGAETDEAIARGLRRAIETRTGGPTGAVALGNQRTQRLMGATRALREAQDRPNALTNMLSILTGSHSIPGAVAMRGMGSSRLGAAAGVGINEAGKALGDPLAIKAAVLAMLLGQP